MESFGVERDWILYDSIEILSRMLNTLIWEGNKFLFVCLCWGEKMFWKSFSGDTDFSRRVISRFVDFRDEFLSDCRGGTSFIGEPGGFYDPLKE